MYLPTGIIMGLLNVGLHSFNFPRSKVSYLVPFTLTPHLPHY